MMGLRELWQLLNKEANWRSEHANGWKWLSARNNVKVCRLVQKSSVISITRPWSGLSHCSHLVKICSIYCVQLPIFLQGHSQVYALSFAPFLSESVIIWWYISTSVQVQPCSGAHWIFYAGVFYRGSIFITKSRLACLQCSCCWRQWIIGYKHIQVMPCNTNFVVTLYYLSLLVGDTRCPLGV